MIKHSVHNLELEKKFYKNLLLDLFYTVRVKIAAH